MHALDVVIRWNYGFFESDFKPELSARSRRRVNVDLPSIYDLHRECAYNEHRDEIDYKYQEFSSKYSKKLYKFRCICLNIEYYEV